MELAPCAFQVCSAAVFLRDTVARHMDLQGRWTGLYNIILAAWGYHRWGPHEACPTLAFAADVISTFLCLSTLHSLSPLKP